MRASLLGAALVAATISPELSAQQDSTRRTVPLAAITVTATRSEKSTFETPQPVTAIDSVEIRERLTHGAADLFRDIAGLDASGVGPNQRRPEIRGQRGQRILLLQDGLRLNNARRQQDFGEVPALAGISSISRVEVVRGPSSVLYGTDAIGGVVNLISAGVPRGYQTGEIHGEIAYRHGTTGDAATPSGALAARFGRIGVQANVAYRDVRDYVAPAGRFGEITLANDALVHDSGVRDRSYRVALSYDLAGGAELFTRAELYSADRAGFGWIDPANLGANQPKIQITYPEQEFSRYTIGARYAALGTVFADRAEITAYAQRNERFLRNDIFIPFGPTASMTSNSLNFTDLATLGARAELAKAIGTRALLTYGMDAFRDRSENTDTSTTVITGFGPPSTRTSNVPSIPNATFRSAGIFAQLELNPVARLTAVVGGRAQDVFAETRETANVSRPLVKGSDRTAVWTAHTLYRVTPMLNAVAGLARGFRAPNLVERFFEGAATESNGFQRANSELVAETNVNVDLGLRFRRGPWYAESFVFRNEIDNAIKGVATGDSVNGSPEFQNRNIGKLRLDGMELVGGVRTSVGVDASASWTRIDGRNISDPNRPIGDSYSSKVVGDVAYRVPSGRFTLGYTLRHQGEQREVIVGQNPIGPVIPSFTVHSARASARLLERAGVTSRLLLSVENIGHALYAEFPNASFFRPEPGRNLSLALVNAF
jgi:hemoglobin/transferrin/lactoferrin receptor protein